MQEAEVYRNGKTDIHRQKEGERVREGRREGDEGQGQTSSLLTL